MLFNIFSLPKLDSTRASKLIYSLKNPIYRNEIKPLQQ